MISIARPLALGSASPRRRELLDRVGLPLTVVPTNIDERQRAGEACDRYLERVTLEKLRAACADPRAPQAGVVLAADTIVLVDGDILGKPSSPAEAHAMLSRLSGRAHDVRTAFALAHAGAEPLHFEMVSTVVHFRALDAGEVARYVATGEGVDKAGAYAIQGIGSFAVRRIEGSYSNVVGLPVCEVLLALQRHGCLGPFP